MQVPQKNTLPPCIQSGITYRLRRRKRVVFSPVSFCLSVRQKYVIVEVKRETRDA